MYKVILIGNHPNDQHESMDRYVDLLFRGLTERGIEVEILKPKKTLVGICRLGKGIAKWVAYIDKFFIFPTTLKRRLKVLHRNGSRFVVHITDQADAVYVHHLQDYPHLVTCHDLIAIRSALDEFPEYPTRATGKIYQKLILNGLRRAAHVVCISNATRSDLLRISGNKLPNVTVIKNALNYSYRPIRNEHAQPLIEGVFQRCGFNRPEKYLLHVGGNEWYKNRRGLIKIYFELTKIYEPPPLVLAGKMPDNELTALINTLNMKTKVFTLGKVSNEELNALYCLAEALVFPSLVEGFGWPLIEANASGCPVIASDLQVFKEIGGDAFHTICRDDVSKAALGIRAYLEMPHENKALLVKMGFQNIETYSAKQILDQYVDVYTQTMHR